MRGPKPWRKAPHPNPLPEGEGKEGIHQHHLDDLLARLLTVLEEAGEIIPATIREAEGLTRYAVVTRYPGLAEPVTEVQYGEAIAAAEAVVRWAANRLRELG